MQKFILFILTVLHWTSSFTQELVSKDTIIRKLRQVRTSISSIDTHTRDIREQVRDCGMIINDALLKLDQAKVSYPLSYVQSIDRLVKFSLELKFKDTVAQTLFLQGLTKDLEAKFTQSSKQMEDGFLTTELVVKIKSLKKGIEISHLRVRYSALGYMVDHNHPDKSFQALTSPAIENMVPGFYEIWLTEDGNFKVLESWLGEISPEKKNEIDFNIL